MRRHARWVPLLLVVSCGGPAERSPVGFQVVVPQITLDRLDDNMHLRIFPRGDFTCDATGTGTVRNGDGTPALASLPGKDVRPDQRCDAATWAGLMSAYGLASPVDQCFAKTAQAMVDVPAGDYIVLVEGSGTVTGAGGTTRTVTLGSGCTAATLTSGQTSMVSIVMIEQQQPAGVCGDGMIDANEECDTSGPTDNCNAVCRFPERTVTSPAVTAGSRRRPSVAWAPARNLVIGFEGTNAATAGADVFVHVMDPTGVAFAAPPALFNDDPVDTTNRNTQGNVRVAMGDTGYVATWETLERNFADSDVDAVGIMGFDAPAPLPMDTVVNVTSRTAGQNRINPSAAVSNGRVAIVFEDQGSATVRLATAAFGSPLPAPAADAALVNSTDPGGSAASDPRIAAWSGGFVAAWSAGAGNKDVYAVLLDPSGAVLGAPVVANTQLGNDQDQVAVAASGSDVVVAWRDASRTEGDTDGTTVRWRHFTASATGTPGLQADGADRIAPTTTAGDQQHPAVAIGRNGVVLIAWAHSDGTIRARQALASGAVVLNRFTGMGGDFELSASGQDLPASTGPRANPVAAYGGTNLFAVAWEDASDGGIHYRTLRDD